MQGNDILNLLLKLLFDGIRQHNAAVFASFGITYKNPALAKIDIPDPQTNTFCDPEAAAIQEFCHQCMRVFDMAKHFGDFHLCKYSRQIQSAFRPHRGDAVTRIDSKNLFIRYDFE